MKKDDMLFAFELEKALDLLKDRETLLSHITKKKYWRKFLKLKKLSKKAL
jgi:hypothetical protein